MIREHTQHYYRQKVQDVLHYIDHHIDGDLSIRTLSEKFHISVYHFHRIMKAALKEPLGSYIDRIRLEIAIKLIRYSEEPLHQIAERIGYADLSSFSKAFSREFGISPADYRNDRSSILNTHIDYRLNEEQSFRMNPKPKILTLREKQLIYVPVTGIYGGEETYQAWEEIEAFVKNHRISFWRPELFTIYYDDPDVVDPSLCRSDVCLVVRKPCSPEGRVGVQSIPGGKFAVFRYQGPYEYLWELYTAIYRDWVMVTGMELRDSPSMEKYLRLSDNTKPEDRLTEIYLPIR